MPQSFPYTKYHFGVFFLFPQFNFNASFQKVSGLGFSQEGSKRSEGGVNGFEHFLTGKASYSTLSLERGLTADMGLYEWCEKTQNTGYTEPCNILVSLLDKRSLPIKNWLLFNAIPKGWNVDGLDASSNTVMVETISLSYQNFILI